MVSKQRNKRKPETETEITEYFGYCGGYNHHNVRYVAVCPRFWVLSWNSRIAKTEFEFDFITSYPPLSQLQNPLPSSRPLNPIPHHPPTQQINLPQAQPSLLCTPRRLNSLPEGAVYGLPFRKPHRFINRFTASFTELSGDGEEDVDAADVGLLVGRSRGGGDDFDSEVSVTRAILGMCWARKGNEDS